MERAALRASTRTGWLDRVVGVNGLTGSSFQAVQVGDTLPPESLLGPDPELAMDSLANFRLSGVSAADRPLWDTALRALHSARDGPQAADVHDPGRDPDGQHSGARLGADDPSRRRTVPSTTSSRSPWRCATSPR